jgi:hypothetical protein
MYFSKPATFHALEPAPAPAGGGAVGGVQCNAVTALCAVCMTATVPVILDSYNLCGVQKSNIMVAIH